MNTINTVQSITSASEMFKNIFVTLDLLFFTYYKVDVTLNSYVSYLDLLIQLLSHTEYTIFSFITYIFWHRLYI